MLSYGNAFETACRAVGLDAATVKDDVRVLQARAHGEASLVATVRREAEGNWQAAAWLLERGYPDRWARLSQRTPPKGERPADPFDEVDELASRRR